MYDTNEAAVVLTDGVTFIAKISSVPGVAVTPGIVPAATSVLLVAVSV